MTISPTCGRPRRLQVNGLDLRLHEWGGVGGPPVLLLHSLAAHGHWWDWVAARLAARYHVTAVDLHHLVLDDPTGFVARVESWLATLRAGQHPS